MLSSQRLIGTSCESQPTQTVRETNTQSNTDPDAFDGLTVFLTSVQTFLGHAVVYL